MIDMAHVVCTTFHNNEEDKKETTKETEEVHYHAGSRCYALCIIAMLFDKLYVGNVIFLNQFLINSALLRT